MNTKALWSVAVLGTVTAFFSACGDGDSTKIKICNAKQTICLNDRDAEVCSADGTAKLPFSCGDGQRCCDPKKEEGCTDAAGDEVDKATCVGDCSPGETTCGSSAVSLVCDANGKGWVTVPCPAGTGCDTEEDSTTYGTCIRKDGEPGTVVICDAGETDCAGDGTLKTCEVDGSNWVYSSCATNENCDRNADPPACVLDPDKGCVPHSGTCVDLTHVKMCADDGESYEDPTACPKGTVCEDGGCQGPVCTVGAIRCDDVRVGNSFINSVANGSYRPQALYSCNKNGDGWEISTCAPTEICVYDNISVNTVNTYIEALKTAYTGLSSGELPVLEVPGSALAACTVPGCATPFALREIFGASAREETAGSFICGDAEDPNADPLASFSLCEGLAPFNNLHWANYLCTEPEVCTYSGTPSNSEESGFIVGPSCSTSCIPGATACYADINNPSIGAVGGVSSTGEGTITCGKDGTYDFSSVKKCLSEDKNPRELWCGPNLQGTDKNYNIGTCMEPACAAWFSVYNTFSLPQDVGACGTDGKFYPCQADGSFGDPTTCSSCQLATSGQLPQITGADQTFAGYDPGTCVTCTEGTNLCLFGDNTTPYYQSCIDGKWATKACSNSELCTEYVDPVAGLRDVKCGADCKPFTAECGGDDGKQIKTCDKNGHKPDDFADCPTGACHNDSQSSNGTYSGSAFCEAECLAGSVLCTTMADEDNAPYYGPAVIKCNGKSRFETASATLCDYLDPQNPERCVDKIGCSQCDPGTFSGVPEVRCAVDADGLPLEEASVQVCKNGEWDDPIACPGVTPVCGGGICSDLGGVGGQGGQGPI